MMGQGFRGNCGSQGKLGMCPSLAEPDSGGIPRTSRRQIKVFRCSSFSKMLPRFRASSPHLRSKLDFATLFFLLQLHVLKLSNSEKVVS